MKNANIRNENLKQKMHPIKKQPKKNNNKTQSKIKKERKTGDI